jgi:proline dehydrogenase
MESSHGPVRDFSQARKIAEVYKEQQGEPFGKLDLEDTAVAFARLSDAELKQAHLLFRLMNKGWLVDLLAPLGLWAVRNRLPLVETLVRRLVYRQFVGGRTLLEAEQAINELWASGVLTILDYGVEAKETEADFNRTMKEVLRCIDFAARREAVPATSVKLTGLARFGLLEEISEGKPFSAETREEYRSVRKRIDAICHHAQDKGVAVYIDAEESWIQAAVDHLVNLMMRRYNRGRVVVYNTFQMYRKDRLQFLIKSYNEAKRSGYMLGAKLVRGAYLEKERERAEQYQYPNPINPTKEATDAAFNTAMKFCVEHYEDLASCNASHNQESIRLQTEAIDKKGIARNHPNLSFSQLYGMSDNLTFNLAKAGYNVSKYVVYGPVPEVMPYLVRRAEENSSVSGDMSRELQFIRQEMKRRGLR